MRSFFVFFLLMVLPLFVRAQKRFDYSLMQKMPYDSLITLLHHATNDTLRMDAFRRLGFYYAQINRDSSLYYGEQQLRLARKLKQKYWESIALKHIGYTYYKMEYYPTALKFLLQAKEIAEDPKIENNIWGLFDNENPQEARLIHLSSTLNHLAVIYGVTGNIAKQLSILKQVFNDSKNFHYNIGLSVATMNIGKVYFRMNKLDSALFYAQKGMYYADISGYTKYKGGILSLIGEIFTKKGQYSSAKSAYQQSIQVSLEQRNFQSLGDAYINLANLYRNNKQIDSSIFYTRKSLKNAQALHSPSSIVSAYLSFYLNYKVKRNIDSSFFYLDKATILNDRLVKVEKEKLKQVFAISLDEQVRLNELEKENLLNDEKTKLYAMGAGLFFLLVISLILYRSYQQKRLANNLLHQKNDQVGRALTQLKTTQNQLIQKEKLASLGELTAGIAHEIQNPLNFVNNFAEVSVELAEELHQSVEENDLALTQSLSDDLRQNMQQIAHNGQRASNIVRAMLEHAQASTGERQAIQLNTLAEEYLRLAYHGFRAKDSLFTATLHTDFQADLPPLEGVVQDLSRVLLNLYNNAFYALRQRLVQEGNGSQTSVVYEPTLWVSTRLVAGQVELRVKDNGMGIPANIRDKVFQPFFTTKPTGQGTGLGLSLSYDIITKGHGGEMYLESQEGQGTEFIIRLPLL